MKQVARRICRKCRQMKPVEEFRVLTHRNRSNGVTVHFGWADRCLVCEGGDGN